MAQILEVATPTAAKKALAIIRWEREQEQEFGIIKSQLIPVMPMQNHRIHQCLNFPY